MKTKYEKLLDEGHSIHHRKRPMYSDDIIVYVLDKNEREIASVIVEIDGDCASTSALGVDHKHQRKGLATEMYTYIEKVTGLTIESPQEERTEQGHAFWNQRERPFGTKKKA